MIKKLPNWCIVNKFPAFYDTESATAIEQTARIYGKMNELVESYNSFAENITNTINGFIGETEEENETFKIALRQEFQDFIDTIDLKILAIEKDISSFETSTNTTVNSLKNDIAQFKSSITTSFNSLNSDISQFKTDINKTAAELTTAFETLENEVNTKIAEFEKAVNLFAERLKSVSGVMVAVNEGDYLISNSKLTSTAPQPTHIKIYRENFVDENVLQGKTWQDENAGSVINSGYIDSNSFIYNIVNVEHNIYKITFTTNEHITGETVELTLNLEINGELKNYGTITIKNVDTTLWLIVEDNINPLVNGNDDSVIYEHNIGKTYLLDENNVEIVTAQSNGEVPLVPSSFMFMHIDFDFMLENPDESYTLKFDYIVSEYATKNYVDEIEKSLNNTWELINTITVTDETTKVECTTDLNGKPFNLKKIAFDAEIKGTPTNQTSSSLYVGLSNSTHELDVDGVLRSTDTQASGYGEIIGPSLEKSKGLNLIIGASGNRTILTSGGIANSNVISYIRFYTANSASIGSGTKINIWGVRDI